jgi:hypothetical protein
MYTSRLQFNKIKTQQIPVYCVSFALRYFVCHYKDYYYYYYIILTSTNKTDHQDITEILLQVSLNTHNKSLCCCIVGEVL